jgi:hypothetical protein
VFAETREMKVAGLDELPTYPPLGVGWADAKHAVREADTGQARSHVAVDLGSAHPKENRDLWHREQPIHALGIGTFLRTMKPPIRWHREAQPLMRC